MIKIENVVLPSPEQWEAIIRGMRNPKNSWGNSDTGYGCEYGGGLCAYCSEGDCHGTDEFNIGPNDHKLMTNLANGGPVHAKYRRMIVVYLDITAPLYWWKEFDTYKVGTVANSCSTMHKIHAKEFTLDDFSCEHLIGIFKQDLKDTILKLNIARNTYIYGGEVFTDDDSMDMITVEPKHPDLWWQMIQLLPSSYNQKRTVMLNYEVLVGIYKWRKNHKLDEWCEFCSWIESLPYSELITGGNTNADKI